MDGNRIFPFKPVPKCDWRYFSGVSPVWRLNRFIKCVVLSIPTSFPIDTMVWLVSKSNSFALSIRTLFRYFNGEVP